MGTGGFNLTDEDLPGLAGQGSMAILGREILADLLTPLGAFLRVAHGAGHAFLLESVEGGRAVARYSFLGARPRRILRIRGGRLTVQEPGGPEEARDGPPLQALRRERGEPRPAPQTGLPPFTGGLVGFFSYDFVRHLERLPGTPVDDLGIPDAVLGDYRTVLAFDHLRNRLILMTALDLGQGRPAAELEDGRRRLRELEALLCAPLPPQEPAQAPLDLAPDAAPGEAAFLAGVEEARRRIGEGEIFQVVLSRRFSTPWSGSPVPVYRHLRSRNPSPYHFFLACGGDHVVGASPEMMVRVHDGEVRVRPIAGTRPRGRDEAEDARLEAELRADAKERAEHVMLVDLARNDVGRVSRPGSVRVEGLAQVERYSHVMHMVSSVRGELAEGKDGLDALAACFPAGTLSGAPKIRAMEIIDATERFRRGPYGGAVAYLDHGGHLDSCITIRSVVLTGGRAHVQAGAGVVADSVPQAELREVGFKAEAMLEALRAAAGDGS